MRERQRRKGSPKAPATHRKLPARRCHLSPACRAPSRRKAVRDSGKARAPHRATVPGSAPRDLHATQPASEPTSVGAERARSRRGRGPADRNLGRGGSRGAGRAGERAPGGAAVPAAGRPRHRWLAGREGFFYRKGRGRICKVPESPPTVLDRATWEPRMQKNACRPLIRGGAQCVQGLLHTWLQQDCSLLTLRAPVDSPERL